VAQTENQLFPIDRGRVPKGNRIEVAPVEPVDPTSPFDSILVPDDFDFTDPHSLRRAFLSRRKGSTLKFVDSNVFLHAYLKPRRDLRSKERIVKQKQWTL
jgi:hypothetical protein